jgi:hemerythrin superfamily protein
MPTSKTSAKSTSTKSSRSRSAVTKDDAIVLLKQEHGDVKKLFTAYQKLADSEASAAQRLKIAIEICDALTLHTTIEEEIFYPAMREATDAAKAELDEAEVEHASVKALVAQIEAMDPDDALFDATVKVLGEYVTHHVKEEEGEMFPKAKKAGLELAEIGEQMRARKEALQVNRLH